MRKIFIGLAMVSVPLAAAQAFPSCTVEKILDVPVHDSLMGPAVSAILNGSPVDLRIMLSSPMNMISLQTVAARDLKLGTHAPGDDIRDALGPISNTVEVRGLMIAGRPVGSMTFVADPKMTSDQMVLGMDFFERFDVELDLPAQVFRLHKPGKSCTSAYWSSENAEQFVAEMLESKAPYLIDLVVRVNNRIMKARMSSTMPFTVITKRAIEQAKLKSTKIAPADIIPLRDGRVPSNIFKIDQISIGNEIISDALIALAPFDTDVDIVLGRDFLEAHRVYISNSLRKIYFSRERNTPFRRWTRSGDE